ncbi:hypothetical protein PVAND_000890 [Polypedilum vanderplanki]|uniref:Uncharacterized protein n=1 Tax=Polypedilum vanderplanki TaxID=319348 RepID=A0A9J6BLJ5_POLVA|nr:hypothetical protein PVAND_000890 [Polypedilum vanderplanki]
MKIFAVFTVTIIFFIANQIETIPLKNSSSSTEINHNETTSNSNFKEENSTIVYEIYGEEIEKFPLINKTASKVENIFVIHIDTNDFATLNDVLKTKAKVKREALPEKKKREIIFRPLFVYRQEQEKRLKRARERAMQRAWWRQSNNYQ